MQHTHSYTNLFNYFPFTPENLVKLSQTELTKIHQQIDLELQEHKCHLVATVAHPNYLDDHKVLWHFTIQVPNGFSKEDEPKVKSTIIKCFGLDETNSKLIRSKVVESGLNPLNHWFHLDLEFIVNK